MEKEEVIKELCQAAYEVNKTVFEFSQAADCFCHHREEEPGFQFSSNVLDFMLDNIRRGVRQYQKDNKIDNPTS